MNAPTETPRGFYTAAFIFEVLAAILLVSPLGSSLVESRWAAGFAGAVLMLAAAVLWPWVIRLLPGPKPWRVFFRRGGSGPIISVYYGFLAGVLIVAYRILLSTGLWAWGASIEEVVIGTDAHLGLFGYARPAVISLAVGIFYFGYVQGFAGRLFGARAGALVAGVAFAVCAGLPLANFHAGSLDVPLWTVFLVLYLPVGLALAYAGRRTRSWVAPTTALFFVAAAVGSGKGILTTLGWVPFLFAAVVAFLIAAEAATGERARLFRFCGGFVSEFFTLKRDEPEPASLLDGVLLAIVTAGFLFFVRSIDLFSYEWYITVTVGLGSFALTLAFWTAGRARGVKPGFEYEAVVETKVITPVPSEPSAAKSLSPANTGADTVSAPRDNGTVSGTDAEGATE